MSKTIDSLNKIEEQRSSKYFRKKGLSPTELNRREPTGTVPKIIQMETKGTVSTMLKFWISILILATIILVLLGFNLKLFLMVKNYSSQKADVLNELNSIKEMVNTGIKQIDTISYNFEQLSNDLKENTEAKIKEIHVDIKQLRDTADAQSFTIENLTKAKDTLFKRVSELEAKAVNEGPKN